VEFFCLSAAPLFPRDLATEPSQRVIPVSVGSCGEKSSRSAACSIDRGINKQSIAIDRGEIVTPTNEM
jgi:hypothetical protein